MFYQPFNFDVIFLELYFVIQYNFTFVNFIKVNRYKEIQNYLQNIFK